jgi:4-methylaminobutanoate oxidase (formaldehyde-forming)
VDKGAAFGLRDAGYYTIDALRVEAGRRAWGAEISPDETPFEAGLAYAVNFEKPAAFIGREALLAQLDTGVRKRLVMFAFDDPAAFPWAASPSSWTDATSASSRRPGTAVDTAVPSAWATLAACPTGPALTDEAILAARYEIDIAGDLFAVTPHMQLR